MNTECLGSLNISQIRLIYGPSVSFQKKKKELDYQPYDFLVYIEAWLRNSKTRTRWAQAMENTWKQVPAPVFMYFSVYVFVVPWLCCFIIMNPVQARLTISIQKPLAGRVLMVMSISCVNVLFEELRSHVFIKLDVILQMSLLILLWYCVHSTILVLK